MVKTTLSLDKEYRCRMCKKYMKHKKTYTLTSGFHLISHLILYECKRCGITLLEKLNHLKYLDINKKEDRELYKKLEQYPKKVSVETPPIEIEIPEEFENAPR